MSEVSHSTPKPRGDTFGPCTFEIEGRPEALIRVLNPVSETGQTEGFPSCDQASLQPLGTSLQPGTPSRPCLCSGRLPSI